MSKMNEAEEICRKALELFNKGELAEAETEIQKALAINAQDSRFRALLSDIYSAKGNAFYRSGDFPQAVKCYEDALKWNADNYNALYNLGNFMAREDNAVAAIEYYRSADESYKKFYRGARNVNALNRWALILQHRQDFSGAVQKYAEAITADADNYFAYRGRAESLAALNQLSEAETDFAQGAEAYRRVVEKLGKKIDGFDEYRDLYNNWGIALDVAGEYEKAAAKYKEAIRIDPDFYFAYRNLGNIYLSTLDSIQAEKCFAQACEAYKNAIAKGVAKLDGLDEYPDAYNDWGIALYQQKRFDEAKEKFKRCIAIQPSFFYAYQNLALIASLQKDYDEALKHLELSLKIDPQSTWSWFQKGLVFQTIKRDSDAVECFGNALKIDKSDAFSQHNIANVHWNMGMYKQAREEWNETLKLYAAWSRENKPVEPNRNFYLYFGWVLNTIFNDDNKAVTVLKKGQELNPENYGVLMMLGYQYRQMAEDDEVKRAELNWNSREYFQSARRIIEKLLLNTKEPDDDLLRNLAQLLLNTDDYRNSSVVRMNAADASKPIRQSVPDLLHDLESRDPESAANKNLLGLYYYRMEDYRMAAQYFKSSLARNPDDLAVWSNLAESYLKQEHNASAYEEYRKILNRAPCHVESLVGLAEVCIRFGEKGDDDFFEKALEYLDQALDKQREVDGSKILRRKDRASACYSRGYAKVRIYENSKSMNTSMLQSAADDFKTCCALDGNHFKARMALSKVKERLRSFSSHRVTESFGPFVIVPLSIFVFIIFQILFIRNYFFGTGHAIDLTSYSLFTFGSIVFMIAGVSLPRLLKLKVAGIELEKSSVDMVSLGGSLGISKDSASGGSGKTG